MKQTLKWIGLVFIIVAVLLPIVIISLSSVGPAVQGNPKTVTTTTQTCRAYEGAEAVLEAMREEAVELGYVDTDEWRSMEAGYWQGYEESHSWCTICNGGES